MTHCWRALCEVNSEMQAMGHVTEWCCHSWGPRLRLNSLSLFFGENLRDCICQVILVFLLIRRVSLPRWWCEAGWVTGVLSFDADSSGATDGINQVISSGPNSRTDKCKLHPQLHSTYWINEICLQASFGWVWTGYNSVSMISWSETPCFAIMGHIAHLRTEKPCTLNQCMLKHSCKICESKPL